MSRPAPRSSRHRSREVALQTLYAVDVARAGRRFERDLDEVAEAGLTEVVEAVAAGRAADPDTAAELDPVSAFDLVAAHFEMPEGAKAFARDLVVAVCAHRTKLDELIAAHARNWRVERMAAVDRNILRIGCHELVHSETPVPVVLNEAVELAQRFAADSSPAFINGVLAAVARDVRGGRP